jgi:hypothetical protein
LVSAKLLEARILSEDLPPRTRLILDEAVEHIESEFAALDKQKIERDTREAPPEEAPPEEAPPEEAPPEEAPPEEAPSVEAPPVEAPPVEGYQAWWRRRRRM